MAYVHKMNLSPAQYVFSTNQEGIHTITLHGRLSKHNQGGIKMRKVKPKVVVQHSNPTNPRCVVNLFTAYLDFIPADGPFYKRPLSHLGNNTPWFFKQNIGHNTLRKSMKDMFALAIIFQLKGVT